MTLKDVILSAPLSVERIVYNDLPSNFKENTYLGNISYVNHSIIKYVMSNNSRKLFFGRKESVLKRIGRQFFLKNEWCDCIIIEDNKITISSNYNSVSLKNFFEFIGIDWCRDVSNQELVLLSKKSILKDVLLRKVYSLETLYKTVLRKVYKTKDISWKTFRDYIHIVDHFYGFTFFDLKVFTKNLQVSLETIIKSNEDKLRLLSDLLHNAVKLNQVVDFSWSDRRLHEEHLKQINIFNFQEISKKEEVEIHNKRIDDCNIKMLNTEKEIFIEGISMHHCLYSCYYERIKQKNYLAFHMTYPEDCTFGVRLNEDCIPCLDQIYLKYDQVVKSSTREIALDFIKSRNDDLFKMFHIKKNLNDMPF